MTHDYTTSSIVPITDPDRVTTIFNTYTLPNDLTYVLTDAPRLQFGGACPFTVTRPDTHHANQHDTNANGDAALDFLVDLFTITSTGTMLRVVEMTSTVLDPYPDSTVYEVTTDTIRITSLDWGTVTRDTGEYGILTATE